MAGATNQSEHDARRQDGILARELAEHTKELIEDALAYTRGHQQRACDLLGCNKVSLWRMIEKFRVDLESIKALSEAGSWLYQTAPAGAPWVEGSGGVEW